MSAKSNFPHVLPFVMQAWEPGLQRWQDSIHGGRTEAEAKIKEAEVRAEPSHWISGKPTDTRVVPALRVKS